MKVKGGLIATQCLINNHINKAILDTGSAYTIIKEAVLIQQNKLHLITPTSGLSIRTANDSKTNLKGKANIILTYNGVNFKVNALVVEDLNIDCIIGLNVLRVNPTTKKANRKLFKSAVQAMKF